jgi:hypothetical protein
LAHHERAAAALILALTHVENTYFRPSWYDGLEETTKTFIKMKLSEGVMDHGYTAKSLAPSHRITTADFIKQDRLVI